MFLACLLKTCITVTVLRNIPSIPNLLIVIFYNEGMLNFVKIMCFCIFKCFCYFFSIILYTPFFFSFSVYFFNRSFLSSCSNLDWLLSSFATLLSSQNLTVVWVVSNSLWVPCLLFCWNSSDNFPRIIHWI